MKLRDFLQDDIQCLVRRSFSVGGSARNNDFELFSAGKIFEMYFKGGSYGIDKSGLLRIR